MLKNKKAILLDMNSTFMFGEDRFGDNEDYSIYYKKIGGELSDAQLRKVIELAYKYLEEKYPKPEHRNNFPSLKTAIEETSEIALTEDEKVKIIETFSFHELGYISNEYVQALIKLKKRFVLGLVIDIWSPKELWMKTFKRKGIEGLFSVISFSSDHKMVKPSPIPFELVVKKLNLEKNECVVVGDSIRRDLGGALAAGIDCVIVGEKKDDRAEMHYDSLLELVNDI